MYPVLKARVKAQEIAFKNGLELENPRSGSTPGAQAEVIAVDEVLKAREAAGYKVADNTLNGLYLHNRSLFKIQYPNCTPKMCDHYASILKDINTIGTYYALSARLFAWRCYLLLPRGDAEEKTVFEYGLRREVFTWDENGKLTSHSALNTTDKNCKLIARFRAKYGW